MSDEDYTRFLARIERTISADPDMILMAGSVSAVDVYIGGGLGKIEQAPGARLGDDPGPLFARSGPDALQAWADVTAGARDRAIYIAVYASVLTGTLTRWRVMIAKNGMPGRWHLLAYYLGNVEIEPQRTERDDDGGGEMDGRARGAVAVMRQLNQTTGGKIVIGALATGFVAFAFRGGCNDMVHAGRDIAVEGLKNDPAVEVTVERGRAYGDSLVHYRRQAVPAPPPAEVVPDR